MYISNRIHALGITRLPIHPVLQKERPTLSLKRLRRAGQVREHVRDRDGPSDGHDDALALVLCDYVEWHLSKVSVKPERDEISIVFRTLGFEE